MKHSRYIGGAVLPRLRGLACAAGLCKVLLGVGAQAAGIVPDGGTATTVSTNSVGRQTVSIAPAQFGVSQNTYSSFSVTGAGATLDNTGINARTIVNQVTSTNPSLIQGDITVAGPRANVVLANPNGITVDGGSFVNTGHVALSTGQVSFDDIQIAPGEFQRNVLLNTQGGTITIGSGGLAGALIGLELIAKNIQLNGPVTNSFSSSTAYVRAIAGSSQVTLNTGLSADDNNNDWLTLANTQVSDPNAVALDVEAAGSITSGRIELIATDLGAGVRTAGALNANAGDFTLTAAGDLQMLAGSSLIAAGNVTAQINGALSLAGTTLQAVNGAVSLSSDGFAAANAGTTETTIASQGSGVLIQSSGDLSNTSSLIQGVTRIVGNAASLGAVTLVAQGNITNTSDPAYPAGNFGIVFGQNDDVSICAGGNVTNYNARIESNQNISVTAQGDIDNESQHTAGANGGQSTSYSDSGHRLLIFASNDDGFSVDYGALPAPLQLSYITAADTGNVTLTARNIDNVGGTIFANDGDVNLVAQQQVLNQALFTGQASYQQSCFIVCHESASSTVQSFGGQIEASNNIAIQAGVQATNVGGNVYAVNGNLTITAPTVTAQGVLGYTAYNRDIGLKAWFGNDWAAIYAADDGGLFEAASGQVTLVGQGVIDGGSFSGAKGVMASNGIVTIAPVYQQPMTIGNHLGLVSWLGL